jgi:hypothetical protein
LRRDIADELADHLQSSFTRELHFTPEETAAKQTVLDRFGDPRRVARQLWFDAMKEKIMSQRLHLVLSSLMTAACLGALGLMLFMLRDSREVNAAILEKLAALAAPRPVPQTVADDSLRSMDWVRPKFKLVTGANGDSPAVGFRVQIQGGAGSAVLGETEKNGQILTGVVEETTGADGIADLGLFRFGSYSLTVVSPWGESLYRQIGLRPGQEAVRKIVCPEATAEEVDVNFRVEWPDDLKAEKLWLICRFGPGHRRVGVESWSSNHALHSPLAGGMGMGGIGMGGMPPPVNALLVNTEGLVSPRSVNVRQANEQFATGSVELLPPSQFGDHLGLPAIRHRITMVSIVKSDADPDTHSYPLLAQYPGSMGSGGMGGGTAGGMGGGFFNVEDKTQTTPFRQTDSLSFEAKPGQPNLWTIRIPDFVLDQVRSSLKSKSGAAGPIPAGAN